ncbi:T9SS type A sorting domain-containing protein, partial [Chitinophagales bacterium]|nr:T9SS type A sorting domain-containing protein [Chitinophagales bacterium]
YTDSNGAYSISAPAGTYYFDINGYNVNNFTPLCPNLNYSVTLDANNPNVTVDFFLTPPPPTQDLSINMYTPYTFTPGFPTYTTVQYCNDGTIPMSGSVVVEYDASLVWYQSGTTPSGYSITNNDVPTSHDSVNHILTYDFSNLLPGQCAYLDVDYETPINTGLMPGDPILIDATVNPIPGDVTPANNVTYLSKVITSSWDPNDKAVSPDGDITVDQNDHAYYIRFQNEGNGNATTVVVKDELDANLDLHSLRNVSASHDYILTIENDNTLVFTFNNIQLVPQSIDEELSQGYVAFTLSQVGDLPIGTVIENTAAIYFDFNPAIVTNTVENEIVEKTTGTINIQVKNALSVYPNPSTGNYQLSLHEMEIRNIRVYDLIGNVLLQLLDLDSEDAEIDLSKHNDGVYFVEVETTQGKAVQKLIKRSK